MVLLRKIREREVQVPPATAAELSPPCTSLIHGLLRRNAAERISFEEFFHHPFITISKSGDPLTSVVGFNDAAGTSSGAHAGTCSKATPTSPVAGGLLTEQLRPSQLTIQRSTGLGMGEPQKSNTLRKSTNKISTHQANAAASENVTTDNEEDYVLVTSPVAATQKGQIANAMFRQGQENETTLKKQQNSEILFNDVPDTDTDTALPLMHLADDVPWQSASRRQFLCHVANIIGSELALADHREFDSATSPLGRASLLLAALHLYTIVANDCRGGLRSGGLASGDKQDQQDQHQSTHSCSTDISAHEDTRELLQIAKSESRSVLKRAQTILSEARQTTDMPGPSAIPDPWILVYRWALLYAEEASTDELLGNYDKATKLYAVAGTLLYFLASESSAMQTSQFGVDSLLFQGGIISESRLRHLASAAAVRWNVCGAMYEAG